MIEWSTACPDWEGKLKRGESIIPAPLFPDEAAAGLSVMKDLRIVDAPGSPTIGEACAQWVFDLAASIFGAYDHNSGKRLITEWFILIPKKNSKSTIAAAIMLTSLIRNWRQSAEFISLAPTVEIANNSYNPARDMVQKDFELDAIAQVQNHLKTITVRESNATLKVVAADSNTVGGKKSVGTLIDELWLFGKMPNAENMFREAIGGLASRPEGFVIWLTTQSDDPPAGIFKQKLQYARDVRDGKIIDPQFVPILYEFPEDMIKSGECRKPENFHIVNPNLNYSVSKDYLERELKKAENADEGTMRGFLAKHLNVEIGLGLRSDRWAGADFWESAAIEGGLTLDQLIDRCEVIDVGIDGGGLDDLLGVSVVGRCKTTRKWLEWGHAWAHDSVFDRRKDIAARLLDFKNDGNLTIVKQIGDDIKDVADIVAEIEASGKLDKIGVDPAGLGGILDAMLDAKIPEEKIVGISQGWKMTSAIKTTERKLAEGVLQHSGQAMMNWCVGNARVESRGNAVIITKQISGSAKIDPLMAMFNAISLMALNPAAPGAKYQMFFV